MRVLLIKTSSMGDVIHTLPALTDARAAIPDLQVDWVVEDSFADLARRHPAVTLSFPVPCGAGVSIPSRRAAPGSGRLSSPPCRQPPMMR